MTSQPRPSVNELAAQPIDTEDLQALRRMAGIYETLDPVPPGLVDRIQFGITLDALHAEIAELQRSGELVGVRTEDVTEAQTVTFTSASLTAMVTITSTSADRRRIDGWVAPGAEVTVELRLVDGSRHVEADADGRFVIDDVPTGLAQFVIRPPAGSDGPPVVTPSIQL